MRPRKSILCVDANEQGLSIRKFALETRGYRVHTAISGRDALARLMDQGPASIQALVSAQHLPDFAANELVTRAKALDPDIFTIIVADNAPTADLASTAHVFLPKGQATIAEILTRLRVGTVRKRGPKKAPAGASIPVPGNRAEALRCA